MTDAKIDAMTPLKPCPFCGKKPHIMQGPVNGYWYVDCRNGKCHIMPSIGAIPKETAIKRWNKRAPT